MIVYEGIFFEGEVADFIRSIEEERLPKKIDKLHCTFKYLPRGDEVFEELVGEEIEVLITGYGCDGKNSGFMIELPLDIRNFYINYDKDKENQLTVPHITTSLAWDAKAVDTKNLEFKPLPEPYVVKGRFGYLIGGRTNSFVSFMPQVDIHKIRKRL